MYFVGVLKENMFVFLSLSVFLVVFLVVQTQTPS